MRVNDLSRVATRHCGGRESNPRPVDRKSSTLTTTLPSCTFINCAENRPWQSLTVSFQTVLCKQKTDLDVRPSASLKPT